MGFERLRTGLEEEKKKGSVSFYWSMYNNLWQITCCRQHHAALCLLVAVLGFFIWCDIRVL